jgi:hypothetical protein
VKSRLLKLIALGGMALAVFAVLASAAKPAVVSATMNPLPPLLSCPNVDGSSENKVTVGDILSVVSHFGKNHGLPGYAYLDDLIMPYNSTSPANTGQQTVADILAVVNKFGQTCPLVDTQIAKATRAISEPMYSDKLCDPNLLVAVNCGGDPQFLTLNSSFLLGKGYRQAGGDVPGQGVHFVNQSLWDGVFNPTRPEGLVYKGGALVAQLYYAEGDNVGWGPDRDHNKGAVNTDSFCTAGCGWNGDFDGWHWHENLCTVGIGTPSPQINRMPSQSACADWGATLSITCTFPPVEGFNCNWSAAVGWMGHLWNWLPNANYTNAVNPNTLGCTGSNTWPTCGECGGGLCSTGESNGRFADCFPDTLNWNAYNCPQ